MLTEIVAGGLIGRTVGKVSKSEALKNLEVDGKKSHNKDLHDKINNKDRQAVLRTDYEREVSIVLKKEIDTMKQSGKYTDEEIASYASQRRREIGIKYKDKTPKEILEKISRRNKEKYKNDKLGPQLEELKKEKTAQEIIESATRPDGQDLKDEGLFDKLEYGWKKYED